MKNITTKALQFKTAGLASFSSSQGSYLVKMKDLSSSQSSSSLYNKNKYLYKFMY